MGLLQKKVIWWFGWVVLFGVMSPVYAKKKAKVTTAAKPHDNNPAEAKASKDCGAWPPKPFPKITTILQLQLEHRCRQQTISTKRYTLGQEDAQVSTVLSETKDRRGIEAKDKRAKTALDELATCEQALEEWMRQEVQRLTHAEPPSKTIPLS